MAEWIPLPFPKCPRCFQSWVRSYHRNCSTAAEVLVEPYLRQVKCEACYKQWELMQNSFFCSCGYTFQASDVEVALSTSELLKHRLLQKIAEMDYFEQLVVQTSKKSFNSWVEEISYEIGRFLGTTVTNAQQLVKGIAERLLGL
ncbi:MAG: hypothetical protein WBC69_21770 [Geitlerinemataceae cyanobacterium]